MLRQSMLALTERRRNNQAQKSTRCAVKTIAVQAMQASEHAQKLKSDCQRRHLCCATRTGGAGACLVGGCDAGDGVGLLSARSGGACG